MQDLIVVLLLAVKGWYEIHVSMNSDNLGVEHRKRERNLPPFHLEQLFQAFEHASVTARFDELVDPARKRQQFGDQLIRRGRKEKIPKEAQAHPGASFRNLPRSLPSSFTESWEHAEDPSRCAHQAGSSPSTASLRACSAAANAAAPLDLPKLLNKIDVAEGARE